MKKFQYSFILLALLATVAACKRDEWDFIRDNTKPSGVGYYPVSSNPIIDTTSRKTLTTTTSNPPAFAAGYEVKVELQYMSESPVKEINLYNTVGATARAKVGTWPYQKAFSNLKRLDTLIVPYVMPASPSGTLVKLEFEILNQNNLNLIRTVYTKVQ